MSRIASYRIARQGQARRFNCFKPAQANHKSCRQLQQLQQRAKCWQLFCANARHGSQTQFSSYLAPRWAESSPAASPKMFVCVSCHRQAAFSLLPIPFPLVIWFAFYVDALSTWLAATFYWLPTRRMMNIDAQRLINCKWNGQLFGVR